ncbi:Myo-inositol oxygenase [seawater metagenome]|uniref:Myo-inositol oxygenase n=1 Tax=seawater metagenome TaxID=1561972 RepID=A0A5E8CJV9_9ZZZZ
MKIAIWGYGRAGQLHYINMISKNDLQLKYVYDPIISEKGQLFINDIDIILNDPEIETVMICTPTHLHYQHIKLCLENNKNVFCEKPISNNETEIVECYALAEQKKKHLFCAFNRRFDPNIISLKKNINTIGHLQNILSISKDYYSYPKQIYLETSQSIFHDYAIHDIDFINWILNDKPISVFCTGNKTKSDNINTRHLDNVVIIMEYSNGLIVTINCSRITQQYDQRIEIQGDKGILLSENQKISFPERYKISYMKELDYFIKLITSNDKNNITKEECINNLIIANACQKSIDTSSKVSIKYSDKFRDYSNVVEAIKNNYFLARKNQTLEFVKKMHKKYLNFNIQISINEIFNKLKNFVDISDPDISLPNYYHGIQTAEAIRSDGHPDWLQLVGLIHDLGKIMYIKGSDKEGTSIKNQWAIVGDTFVVGCKIPDGIVFPEFNKENPDMKNNNLNSELGIYKKNCGLDNLWCSWGHDEYLYQILKYNNSKIPEEGLYIIRFHSLYSYHKNGEYKHFMNKKDKKMIKWLKIFNKYDLYTKSDDIKISTETKKYYNHLIEKYINNGKIYI